MRAGHELAVGRKFPREVISQQFRADRQRSSAASNEQGGIERFAECVLRGGRRGEVRGWWRAPPPLPVFGAGGWQRPHGGNAEGRVIDAAFVSELQHDLPERACQDRPIGGRVDAPER